MRCRVRLRTSWNSRSPARSSLCVSNGWKSSTAFQVRVSNFCAMRAQAGSGCLSRREVCSPTKVRVARFELVRPLKHGHITADQPEERNWETEDPTEFRRLWQAEV